MDSVCICATEAMITMAVSMFMSKKKKKKEIYSCRRNDLELPNVECILIEVSIQHRNTLIDTFYKHVNAAPAILTFIEDSTGLAYDTTIQNILMTADFNLDTLTPMARLPWLCQTSIFSS